MIPVEGNEAVPNDFGAFFERATKCTPFPYQRRLADATKSLPELLQVPTGTGKTAAAVLAWLWRRQTRPTETPRRLVYCLPMRVLVGQTRACAALWLHRLDRLAGRADLAQTGDRVLKYEPRWGEHGKVAIATLMGGETDDRWREQPESELIIVGTQDMLISRALNRGYAAWPQEWPVEFGLLNVDTLWVMDEVQLMGPARTTSIQLQLFAEEELACKEADPLPSRRTLWMSATLGALTGSVDPAMWMKTPEWGERRLRTPVEGAREEGSDSENDLAHIEFAKRWRAPKQLESRTETADQASSPPSRRRRARKLATPDLNNDSWIFDSPDLLARIAKEARSAPHRTVLVFANRVDRARELFKKLELATGEPPLLLHARFRPRDRRAAERRLLESAPHGGRIIVSTQVLEAGVDLDAQTLFTEVCPWQSLVQRVGRLNRRGEQETPPAMAVVFDVPRPVQRDGESEADYHERARKQSSLPYEADDLDVTRQQLRAVLANGGSLSPEALASIQVPLELTGPVLRRFDLDDFFDTDPDLAGGHTDVSPFVRALDRDDDAYVLWRRLALPPDDQPPMHPDELCPVPFFEAQEAFAGHEVWILTLATGKRHGSAWRRARASDVRAGDTVMVDLTAGCYQEESGWLGKRQGEHRPGSWVDRWDRSDGTSWRAWARGDASGAPAFVEADVVDSRLDARRGCAEEQRSFTKRWMELEDHSRQAEDHVDRIVRALALPPSLADAARTAARWHDVGKALERSASGQTAQPFQDMLRRGGRVEGNDPRAGVLYAKSNGRGGGGAGFRHEVASVLAYLVQPNADDLVAYLVLAHMGKVRLLPTPWDADDPVDANGVRPGDWVPAAAIPNGSALARLDPALFLPSRSHPGWQGRVAKLLERLGPFGLAYLEALVRVADWRAS